MSLLDSLVFADELGIVNGETVEEVEAVDTALTDHTGDAAIHFTEASIDHAAIQNIGTNTHSQIDSALTTAANHRADATIHFLESDIDHTAIQNIGTNSHALIDAYITEYTTAETLTASANLNAAYGHAFIDASGKSVTAALPAPVGAGRKIITCLDDTNGAYISGTIHGTSQTVQIYEGESVSMWVTGGSWEYHG